MSGDVYSKQRTTEDGNVMTGNRSRDVTRNLWTSESDARRETKGTRLTWAMSYESVGPVII